MTTLLSVLISLAFQGVLLMVSVGLAGGAAKRRNTYGRAFVTALALAVVQAILLAPGLFLLALVYPIAALFALRLSYEIGWIRALVIALVSFVLWALVAVFVLLPLGLLSAAFSQVFGV